MINLLIIFGIYLPMKLTISSIKLDLVKNTLMNSKQNSDDD